LNFLNGAAIAKLRAVQYIGSMKKLTVLLLSVLTSAAYATSVGPGSTWKEINEAGLVADFPAIQFGSVFVTVDALCSEREELRTIDPVTYCVEWNDELDCLRKETRHLDTPIHADQALEYWVPVGEYAPPEGSFSILFYKFFEI